MNFINELTHRNIEDLRRIDRNGVVNCLGDQDLLLTLEFVVNLLADEVSHLSYSNGADTITPIIIENNNTTH